MSGPAPNRSSHRSPASTTNAILTLRSVPDIDAIKEHIDARRPERAVVIGAGFIGLEMAENLRERGVFVTIVEALDQVMNVIDPEMAAIVHRHIKAKEVELYLADSVTAFGRKDGRVVLRLKSGRNLPADMVILSIGVRPDTKLARDAGLALDPRGAILVDSRMSPLTHKAAMVPLVGPANKQARIAADTIVKGKDNAGYRGAIGTSIAKVFDLTVACTGLSEKAAEREGMAHEAVIVHPSSHAGYYPDAKPFSLKVAFDPVTGTLLGAQAVGYEGVDKRIDVIAAFLSMGAGIDALTRFEYAYAPPFASAKDPVNYAGFVAENFRAGLTAQVRWNEVAGRKADGAFILDVRTPEEFALGHIAGSINISNTAIRDIFHPGKQGFGKTTAEPVAYGEGSGMPEAIAARSSETILIDACGLQCPGPIMRLKSEFDRVSERATLRIRATDAGFARDAKAWCHLTGNSLVGIEEVRGTFEVSIQKTSGASASSRVLAMPSLPMVGSKEATIIVFSDDFDRALASFVIANGAAASGKKVTMFFTFWGLSVVKRRERTRATKDFMGRIFGMMLPRNSRKLSLSRMNFGGIGATMMKGRMVAKWIDQLEIMIESALKAGVRITACQMSMNIMGVAREELMDGVEIGGVASYLEAADSSNLNLFV